MVSKIFLKMLTASATSFAVLAVGFAAYKGASVKRITKYNTPAKSIAETTEGFASLLKEKM